MPAGQESQPATSRTPQLTPALIAVAIVTAIAVIAAGTSGGWWLAPRPWFDGISLAGNSATPPALPTPSAPPSLGPASPLQQWIAGALMGFLALSILVGLGFLARWLWQRRPRRAVVIEDKPVATPAGVLGPEPDLSTLLQGAETAERILAEPDGQPRDLVLRCWLAIEDAAARSGLRRAPSDSPSEFTGAVLRSTAADRTAVDTLLHLYHRARFSPHPVSDDDVRAARTAVVRLAATWRGFDTAMRRSARTDP